MTRKKKNSLTEKPAFEPFKEEPAQETWIPAGEEPPIIQHELPPPEVNITSPEEQAALEEVMTPEPVVEEDVEPVAPVVEEDAEPIAPVVEEDVEPVAPVVEEDVEPVAPVVEEVTEPVAPVVEEVTEPVAPVVEEDAEPVAPVVEEVTEPVAPVVEEVTEPVAPVVEEVAEPVAPVVEEDAEPVAPVVESKPSEEDKKIAAMTQQAADLKAAIQKAQANQQIASSESTPRISQRKQVEKAVDERRRRVLLGKHATKTIMTDSGTLVVEIGAEVTEEVLQRARLSNKFIELSMNVK